MERTKRADCGGDQSGPLRWHWMSCKIRFGRTAAARGRDQGRATGQDRRRVRRNRPGSTTTLPAPPSGPPTASSGPQRPAPAIETLCYLLGDAQVLLGHRQVPPPPLPETACQHAPKARRRSTKPRPSVGSQTRRDRRYPPTGAVGWLWGYHGGVAVGAIPWLTDRSPNRIIVYRDDGSSLTFTTEPSVSEAIGVVLRGHDD